MSVFKEQFGTTDCDGGQSKTEEMDICPEDSSVIVAILSAGTVLGALLAAPIGDSIGRRKSLLVAVALFCVGAIFQVCAQAIPMLLVGRYAACRFA